MARPLKKLNLTPEQIEYLASIGCTDMEISYLAGFKDQSTLVRRFARILAKGREGGKTRLRKLQWQAAIKGNVTMQIWLGKQLLGQEDHIVQRNSNFNANADLTKLTTEQLKQIRDVMTGKEPDANPKP
jgi:hypothetical protein